MKTVTEAFGPDIANRLAMWAIDVACYPPADISTFSTRVRADLIREGRQILDAAGLDWRALKHADPRSETTRRKVTR